MTPYHVSCHYFRNTPGVAHKTNAELSAGFSFDQIPQKVTAEREVTQSGGVGRSLREYTVISLVSEKKKPEAREFKAFAQAAQLRSVD